MEGFIETMSWIGHMLEMVVAISMFTVFIGAFHIPMFMKAGYRWKDAVMPIWNVTTFTKIAWGSRIPAILFLIPVVNFIFGLMTIYRILVVRFEMPVVPFMIIGVFFEPMAMLMAGIMEYTYHGTVHKSTAVKVQQKAETDDASEWTHERLQQMSEDSLRVWKMQKKINDVGGKLARMDSQEIKQAVTDSAGQAVQDVKKKVRDAWTRNGDVDHVDFTNSDWHQSVEKSKRKTSSKRSKSPFEM